jgi:hypothetical protein
MTKAEAARLDWLLAFARRDLSDTTPDRLEQVSIDVARNILRWTVTRDSQESAALQPWVRWFQEEIEGGLTILEAGGQWRPFDKQAVAPPRPMLKVQRGSLVRTYVGSPRDQLLVNAMDLLVAGWRKVRRCAHCDNRFVATDPRQHYCSPEHSRRARWEKFAPHRERDYHAEYERRQQKRLGTHVKVGRRAVR